MRLLLLSPSPKYHLMERISFGPLKLYATLAGLLHDTSLSLLIEIGALGNTYTKESKLTTDSHWFVSFTIKVTFLYPSKVKAWLGFCSLLLLPSPKSQIYCVMGPLPGLLLLLKRKAEFKQPCFLSTAIPASGFLKTSMKAVLVLVWNCPELFSTVRLTV